MLLFFFSGKYWILNIFERKRHDLVFFLFLYRYEIFDIIRPRRYHGNFKVYRLLIEYEFYPVTDIDFYEKKIKKKVYGGVHDFLTLSLRFSTKNVHGAS